MCISQEYIHKVGLKVSVVDGIDTESLKYAVGHFSETAKIGEAGNCAIAGHRSYTYNQFFNRLDEVAPGDDITIISRVGEYVYRVYDKRIIEPTEPSVLKATKESIITLITCHPERSSAYRLVVVGKLIESSKGLHLQ